MRIRRLLIPSVVLTMTLVGLLLGGRQSTPPIRTVRDVLRQNGIPVSPQIPANLIDAPAASLEVDSDSRDFVMAFYALQGNTQNIDRIRIMLLERSSGRWSFGSVTSSQTGEPGFGN